MLAGSDSRRDDLVLLASGSEVHVALAAGELLRSEHGLSARVVSMPSWELFEQQDQAYRDSVIPPDVTARVAVEQASTFGWARFTGLDGARLGMRTFGASAPLQELQRKFGFTVERIVAAAREQVQSDPGRRT